MEFCNRSVIGVQPSKLFDCVFSDLLYRTVPCTVQYGTLSKQKIKKRSWEKTHASCHHPGRATGRANKARIAQARQRRRCCELPIRGYASRHDGDRSQCDESMNPPSMIVCVNRATTFHGAISTAKRFAINILHRSQIEISMGCGGKTRGEDRFGHGAWGE